jgi:hypothetical protein
LALILAGYDKSNTPVAVNGNASIGAVSVGGDWIASSLVAGVQDDADAALDEIFGDTNDQAGPGHTLVNRIASVLIKGLVIGSAAAGDHFGFVAQQIGSFNSMGFTAALTAGTDVIEVSLTTSDVTIREI